MSLVTDIMILWTNTDLKHNNSLCKEYMDYVNWCGCMGTKRCLRCVLNRNGWYLAIKKGDDLNSHYQLIIDETRKHSVKWKDNSYHTTS